jgi:filamentous hemagglutinin family protein
MLKNLYRLVSLIMVPSLVFLPVRGFALPEGGNIADGTGNIPIVSPGDTSMTITQTSDRMIADYTSFNILTGESVTFAQHLNTDIALNRINDANPSQILGALTANGRIFLINPNGILFGAGSQINTAGLVASTLNMDTTGFTNPATTSFSFSGGGSGSVINNSLQLNSPGGFVALLGTNVLNTGVITANLGTIYLASGNAMTLSLDAQNLISVAISAAADPGLADAGVVNSGTLRSDVGRVLINGQVIDSVLKNAVNNSGIIEASDIEITGNHDVVLSAGSKVTAKNNQDEAYIRVQSTDGNVSITDSDLYAAIEGVELNGDGEAYIDVLAGSKNSPNSTITISDSDLETMVEGSGSSEITLTAGYFQDIDDDAEPGSDTDVDLYQNGIHLKDTYNRIQHLSGTGKVTIEDDSNIDAEVAGVAGEDTDSDAGVFIKAHDVDINDSFITAITDNRGPAVIDVFAGLLDYYHKYNEHQDTFISGGTLNVKNSGILASAGDGVNGEGSWGTRAQLRLISRDVTLDGSAVVAQQKQSGQASVEIIAANYQNVQQDADGNSSENYSGGELTIQNPVPFTDTDEEGGHMLVSDFIPSVGALVGENGEANVDLTSGGDVIIGTINLNAASVLSQVMGEGDASVNMSSGNSNWSQVGSVETFNAYGADLNILNKSKVLAETGSGDADIEIHGGDVVIDDSKVISRVDNDGSAQIYISGGDYSDTIDYNHLYTYTLPDGTEPYSTMTDDYESWGLTGGQVTISGNSEVSSLVDTAGYASVGIDARDIDVNASAVQAKVASYGEADVNLRGGDIYGYEQYYWGYNEVPEDGDWYEYSSDSMNGTSTVTLENGASVLASIGNSADTAMVNIQSGDIVIDNSTVEALSTDPNAYGNADIYLYAQDNYYDEDILGSIRIDHGSMVKADVAADNGNAYVSMNVYNYYPNLESTASDLSVLNGSSILANVGSGLSSGESYGYGYANIYLSAYGGYLDKRLAGADAKITIDNNSKVKASVRDYGYAYVGAYANSYQYFNRTTIDSSTRYDYRYSFGEIDVTNNSSISSSVGYGQAGVNLAAANINIANKSLVEAFTTNQERWANAYVWLIDNSYVEAYSGEYDDSVSGNIISVDDSTVKASVAGGGYAEVYFGPEEYEWDTTEIETGEYGYYNDPFDVNITNGSIVTASVGDLGGDAEIDFDVKGNLTISEGSNLTASVDCDGYSLIDMNLYGDWSDADIYDSTLISKVNGSGDAEIYIYNDLKPFELVISTDFLDDLDLGLDLEDINFNFGNGGAINGGIDIGGSTIHAEAATEEGWDDQPSSAIIGFTSEDPIWVEDGHISAQEAFGDAFVGLMSDSYIYVDELSTISAKSNDMFAAVGLLAGGSGEGGSVYMNGKITADAGAGFGLVGIAGPDDLYLPGTISASGSDNIMPLAEYYLSRYYGELYEDAYLEIPTELNFGSGILMLSEYGDIILGNDSADAVLGAALEGSIYQTPTGLVSGKLLGLVADHDIGSVYDEDTVEVADSQEYNYGYDVCGPIKTDVDILAAYSFGWGDIAVDEANDIQLGLVLPVTLHDSETDSLDAILGMAVAANEGDIFIRSQGDMVINSVIAPWGGVFLQSEHGSMYAGTGWDPFEPVDLASFLFNVDFLTELNMDKGYAPVVFTFADPEFNGTPYNLVAGGYSYLSTPEGTIGVGTPDEKDPSISGEVAGIVWPPVEAVTCKWPSPGIDLSRYTPPGLVYFHDDGRKPTLELAFIEDDGGEPLPYAGDQIWPESIADPEISSGNPLLVYVDAWRSEDTRALPDWFYAPPVNEGPVLMSSEMPLMAGLTLEIGPKPQPNPIVINNDALLASALTRDLRAYYEVMSPTRFQSMVPASMTNFFGYHPLIETDMSAFDGITLDAGAYDFISDNIRNKKKIDPYYGL